LKGENKRVKRMAVCGVIGHCERIVPILIDLDRRPLIAGGCSATLVLLPRQRWKLERVAKVKSKPCLR